MTREEAIGHLRNMKMPHDKFYEETDETNKTLIDKGNEALDMATKALAQTRWIPVSERLPEEYKEVFVTDIETSDAYLSRYIGNGYWECDNGLFKNRIIAWQPLPQPYKAESEDNG